MKKINRRKFLQACGAGSMMSVLASCGIQTQSTTAQPSATTTPTIAPSAAPTAEPTPEPTAEPTPEPTAEPTPEPTPTGPVIEEIDGVTYVDGILIVNKTYALPNTYGPGGLTAETQAAFDAMAQVASAQGLTLYISSAFRSYDYQEQLYNKYVARDGQELADTYSARAGHSEHQTGLAFDLNTISDSFAYTAEGQWAAQNAQEYGFIVRYPSDKTDITGYKYEPWHLRFLGQEIATSVYESGLCLEEYLGITSEYQSV